MSATFNFHDSVQDSITGQRASVDAYKANVYRITLPDGSTALRHSAQLRLLTRGHSPQFFYNLDVPTDPQNDRSQQKLKSFGGYRRKKHDEGLS